MRARGLTVFVAVLGEERINLQLVIANSVLVALAASFDEYNYGDHHEDGEGKKCNHKVIVM